MSGDRWARYTAPSGSQWELVDAGAANALTELARVQKELDEARARLARVRELANDYNLRTWRSEVLAVLDGTE